jgi:hypothetical protein
LEKRTQE